MEIHSCEATSYSFTKNDLHHKSFANKFPNWKLQFSADVLLENLLGWNL